jgi:preprotein translocase subunit SecB
MKNMSLIPISPLQLKSHSFPIIRLQAMPGGKNTSQTSFNRNVSFIPLPERPNEWQLELTIKIASVDPTNPFLYDLEVIVIGIVEVRAELPEEQKKQIAVVNGFSILYGAVREMVINLTCRSPYGPLTIPTITFTGVLKLDSEKFSA